MLEVYNTQIRKKEQFKKKDKNIKLFVCGPTVYNDTHIGHGRTYISFDLIKSYLEFIGYSVFYIINITDIDDKIINKAKIKNLPFEKVANYYENKFIKDMELLNVDSVNLYPKVTYHLNKIFNQIEELINKGFAYETEKGVYFETEKFSNFGNLSNKNLNKLNVHRIQIDDTKKNPKDFVLWKKIKEKPYYPSKWGNGRPGWHISDIAIINEYFGSEYDIHGGGLDLIFPHHEAIIAQMEAISRKSPSVKYWMHTGFLNVDGIKMSKSVGNFLTIRDLLDKWDPMVYRLFVLSNHYRSPIDFSTKSLNQSAKNLERLNRTIGNLVEIKKLFDESDEKVINNPKFVINNESDENDESDENQILYKLFLTKKQFFKDMDDDFNTPKALATILSFTKIINAQVSVIKKEYESFNKIKNKDKMFILDSLNFLKDFDKIFKLNLFILNNNVTKCNDSELLQIISYTRKELRKEKNYKLSDEIRNKLNNLGLDIED